MTGFELAVQAIHPLCYQYLLVIGKLPQNALRRDSNGKCIERVEGHYLEVVVEVYVHMNCLKIVS